MTVSNAITLSRIALAPVFVALLVAHDNAGDFRDAVIVSLWVIYGLIEISDLADGYFARRLRQESELGRVLDPFADSLSRLSCFLGFTVTGLMPLWIFVIVLYRDLWISFLRVLTAKEGVLLGARLSGKIKAWVYAIANLTALASFTASRVLLFFSVRDILSVVSAFIFWVVVATAFWSGFDYSVAFFNGKLKKKAQEGVD